MKKYMRAALDEAKKAFDKNEMPIGAVVVCNGKIISRGHNTKEIDNNPIGHAEINAIVKACKKRNDWRLNDCLLFVNVEPCLMCYGLIYETRIRKIYCSLKNNKFNDLVSKFASSDNCIIEYGLLENESKQLLKDFFEKLRNCKG